jgi:hypothetical protein
MFVAEIIDKANLRAKALPIRRDRGLYEPMRLSLNSRSLRAHGIIAVNICFGVRLQQASAINYAGANEQKPEMPPEDFERDRTILTGCLATFLTLKVNLTCIPCSGGSREISDRPEGRSCKWRPEIPWN